MGRRNWTREETLLAFNLYCNMPFGKIHGNNPDIIELATIIGRTPAALAMKMCNLAAHDPSLRSRGVKGLAHGCKMEEEIWLEFQHDWEGLAYESQTILQALHKCDEHKEISNYKQLDNHQIPVGSDRLYYTKQRVGQQFFRSAVLNAYNNKCCITGLSINPLLVASHIKPWKDSDEKTERTNPCNGLCLNSLHDRAFDQGLITIDNNYNIIISEQLRNMNDDDAVKRYIISYEGHKIQLPSKFLPDKIFIEYHNDVIFKRG